MRVIDIECEGCNNHGSVRLDADGSILGVTGPFGECDRDDDRGDLVCADCGSGVELSEHDDGDVDEREILTIKYCCDECESRGIVTYNRCLGEVLSMNGVGGVYDVGEWTRNEAGHAVHRPRYEVHCKGCGRDMRDMEYALA